MTGKNMSSLRVLGIFVLLALVLNLSLISTSNAASIVTEDEKVLYYGNQALMSFKVKVVYETEEDGGWRVIESNSTKQPPYYEVKFFITVTYLNSDMLDLYNIQELRIVFYNPYFPDVAKAEAEQTIEAFSNESWFSSRGSVGIEPLVVDIKPLYENEYRLTPYLHYTLYNHTYPVYPPTEANKEVFFASSIWSGETTYIQATKSSTATSDVVGSQLDSLKTELDTIRNLMYGLIIITTVFLCITTIYFTRKSLKKSITKPT